AHGGAPYLRGQRRSGRARRWPGDEPDHGSAGASRCPPSAHEERPEALERRPALSRAAGQEAAWPARRTGWTRPMSNDHLKPAPEAWWRTHMAATQIRRLLGDNGLAFSQGALLALGEPDLVCENPHGPNRPSMRLWLIERVYGRLASLKTPVPDPIPAQPEEVSLAAAWTRIRQARAL